MFRKLLTFVALMVLVVATYAAILATEWLPRPDPAETAALAVLDVPPPPVSGPNAYAVVWFLYHDVDPESLQRRMKDDVARSRELAAAGRGDDFAPLDGAEPDAERLAPDAFCPPAPESCLGHVRALDDRGAAQLAGHHVLLRRLDVIHQATHLRYPFDPADPLRIAPYGGTMHVTRMAAASRFAAGDRPGGLGMACRDLATWRRLAPTTNLLIDGLIANAWSSAYATLIGEMLAEWPADEPLPPPCTAALAPLKDDERDRCEVWRGEFRWVRANMRRPYAQVRAESDPFPKIPSPIVDVLLNARAASSRAAVDHARGCAEYGDAPAAATDDWDLFWDPGGMLYESLTEGAGLGRYRDRFSDHLDLIQALRLQAHLRGTPDVDTALRSLPADFAPLPPTITVDAAARTVTLRLREPGDGEAERVFALPPRELPAAPGEA